MKRVAEDFRSPAQPITPASREHSCVHLSSFIAHPSRRRNRRAGFTLIEVLATVLLLSIVVPVAMQAVSLATATTGAARQRSEAAGLAEYQLGYAMTTGEWQTGPFQGDFTEFGHPEYQWEIICNNWTQSNMVEMTVTVYWRSDRRGDESVSVSSLVYQLGFDEGSTEGTTDGTTGTSGTGGTP